MTRLDQLAREWADADDAYRNAHHESGYLSGLRAGVLLAADEALKAQREIDYIKPGKAGWDDPNPDEDVNRGVMDAHKAILALLEDR